MPAETTEPYKPPLQSKQTFEKQYAGTNEAEDHTQQQDRMGGDSLRHGADPAYGSGKDAGHGGQQGTHGHISSQSGNTLGFDRAADGAGITGLAWSNASGVRLVGGSPDMAGAQLGDGFCLGFITTGAAIANHTGDKAGSGCTGGFDPVVLQSGEGFGLFGRTDGTGIINLSGSGAGGRESGGLCPGVVLGQLGNAFHLGFITAGTVVIDGSCGDAGCRSAAGFRPVVA